MNNDLDDPELTWEQKLRAIMALAGACSDVSLYLRPNPPVVGDPDMRWYLCMRELSIADAHSSSSIMSEGTCPQEAVKNAWASLTTLDGSHVVQRFVAGKESHHRWNGFMWIEVERPK